MTPENRTPTKLAALAGSAVSGLDPATVRSGRDGGRRRCDVAFVTDTQHRTWVIRAPRTAAVGAQLETAVTLLGHLGRRLPFGVPTPRGFVSVPQGRAMVYPVIHGRTVQLDEVPPGPGVAAEIGRAVAAIHNIDPAVYDDAGMPSYEPDAWRTRRLADLDRAAATGHVPTALLERWERALENVPLWKFAETPTHGDLTGSRILVTFSDEQDATTASIRGVTGWEDAHVGDPADDLAAVVGQCTPAAAESILEAYALARIERPDRNLHRRATLSSEMRLLTDLLEAVGHGDAHAISVRAARLRDLDERLAAQPFDLEPEPTPERPKARPVVASAVSSEVFEGFDGLEAAPQIYGIGPDQSVDRDLSGPGEAAVWPGDNGAVLGADAGTGSDASADADGTDDVDESGTTGPVLRVAVPATAAGGPAADATGSDAVASADSISDDLDESDSTQLLKVGERADATTVIPRRRAVQAAAGPHPRQGRLAVSSRILRAVNGFRRT